MATRKKTDTEPKIDESSVTDYPESTVALSDAGFASVVRLIKLGRVAQVMQLKEAVQTNMKRLRLRSKGAAPVAGIPEGSDQINVGSLITWAGSVRHWRSSASMARTPAAR